MSSVISSIPGAEIELNSESVLSHGLQFTTASVSAASILSRLPKKGPEELSDLCRFRRTVEITKSFKNFLFPY